MSLNTRLTQAAHRIWRHKGIVSTLLLPLSWLSAAFIRNKQSGYRRQPARIFHSSLPVVVVGNIYVGGTGKTPVVMALVQALQQRGWQPGVISRGYGVTANAQARTGRGQLNAFEFGDEPTLIAGATGAPVSVHPRRALAMQALQRDFPEVDVVVADDGLQHLALGRDLEILVQDGRGIGNGRLLPAGPLREPATRLHKVDYVVNNLQAEQVATPIKGDAPTQLTMRLQPVKAVHLVSGTVQEWSEWLSHHSQQDISAVAAIGQPQRFFGMLRAQGLQLSQAMALPDHDPYESSPFAALPSAIILITAKDAVKCVKFADSRLWVVHVEPAFSDPQWLDTVHHQLTAVARKKKTTIAPAAS